MSLAYADDLWKCEIIDECGEICADDPNCEISEWTVQSEPITTDNSIDVEVIIQENNDLKIQVQELQNRNSLLESQVDDLKLQLENAQAMIIAQLNVIVETLANLKLSN